MYSPSREAPLLQSPDALPVFVQFLVRHDDVVAFGVRIVEIVGADCPGSDHRGYAKGGDHP
jgi:hypothetical protein